MQTEAKRKFLIDIAFFVVVVAIIYILFKFLSVYLLPFVIGIAVSFIVQKPVKAINKKTRIPKGPITVFFVIFTYFAIVAVLTFVCFLLYQWLANIVKLLPSIIPTITSILSDFNASLSEKLTSTPDELVTFINNLPSTLIGNLTKFITNLLSTIAKSAATGAPKLLISVIITVVASCYIASGYDSIIKFAYRHTPNKIWSTIIDVKQIFGKNLIKMLKGYLLLMIITFAELSIGLLIIGQNNAVMLAAIICVIDILPVLGTGAIVIPWALISLITGNIWKAIGLLILYIFVTIIRNFLEPKVIGDQVGMHPLLTLLSMFCGLKLIGFIGMFVFPLILIIIVTLYKNGKIKLFVPNSPASKDKQTE